MSVEKIEARGWVFYVDTEKEPSLHTPYVGKWMYFFDAAGSSFADKICKKAVETNYWPLFEVVEGKWILNYEPKNRLPIEEFLKTQGRFKHLFKPENEHLIEKYQKEVDRRWEDLLFKCSR